MGKYSKYLAITHEVQGVPKKMVFSGKMAITTFKLMQIAKVSGVLENSAYLPQQHRHFFRHPIPYMLYYILCDHIK